MCKVLVVGDAGAGKTCIIRRYVHNMFQIGTKSTLGVDFALKLLRWERGDRVLMITLQVWDIAGQERYGQMTRAYYQSADGALVVFDITRPETFAAVQKWKQDIDDKVLLRDGRPIPCVLLGNKCDITPLEQFKSKQEMEEYCSQLAFAEWFETSAMRDVGVKQGFEKLVELVVANDASHPPTPPAPRRVTLDPGARPSKKKCAC